MVQQTYRSAADDPQIELARELKIKVEKGQPVEQFMQNSIDIGTSLSTFVTFYDVAGKPLYSSGYLDGKMPVIPPGVFDFTSLHGEHSVTWQPRKDVRIAMVILKCNGNTQSFVSAGRSLLEIELRERSLIKMIAAGWLICMALVMTFGVLNMLRSRYV